MINFNERNLAEVLFAEGSGKAIDFTDGLTGGLRMSSEDAKKKSLYPQGVTTKAHITLSHSISQAIGLTTSNTGPDITNLAFYEVSKSEGTKLVEVKYLLVGDVLIDGVSQRHAALSVASTYNKAVNRIVESRNDFASTLDDFTHPFNQLMFVARTKMEEYSNWNNFEKLLGADGSRTDSKLTLEKDGMFALNLLVYNHIYKPFISASQESFQSKTGLVFDNIKPIHMVGSQENLKVNVLETEKIKIRNTGSNSFTVVDISEKLFKHYIPNDIEANDSLMENHIFSDEILEMIANLRDNEASISIPTTVAEWLMPNNLELLQINKHVDLMTRNPKLGYDEAMFDLWEENMKYKEFVNDSLPLGFFQEVLMIKEGIINFIEYVGEAGSGKTTQAKIAAYLLGLPCVLITGDSGMERASIFGQMELDENNKISIPLTDTVRTLVQGGLLIFDEWTTVQSDALMSFNSIMDGSRQLMMLDGKTRHKVSPNTRIIFTSNPASYSGTQDINAATANRMSVSYVPKPTIAQLSARLANVTKYNNLSQLAKLANIESEISKLIKEEGAGRVISPRNIEAWVNEARITGEFLESSVRTILTPLSRNDVYELEYLNGKDTSFATHEGSDSEFINQVTRIIRDAMDREVYVYRQYKN